MQWQNSITAYWTKSTFSVTKDMRPCIRTRGHGKVMWLQYPLNTNKRICSKGTRGSRIPLTHFHKLSKNGLS